MTIHHHIVFAGASLGATTDKISEWGETFRDPLQVAINLHNIKQVIILDHRDCGACKTILGGDFARDPAKETQIPAKCLAKLSAMVVKLQSNLDAETLLMNPDAIVEVASVQRADLRRASLRSRNFGPHMRSRN